MVTCEIAEACTSDVCAISLIDVIILLAPFTTSVIECAVSLVIFAPLSTTFIVSKISVSVFFAASVDLLARSRTSLATTEKPLPAVPALAASTEAFNARIFVWKAISSMVLIIFPISLDLLLISEMASSNFFI